MLKHSDNKTIPNKVTQIPSTAIRGTDAIVFTLSFDNFMHQQKVQCPYNNSGFTIFTFPTVVESFTAYDPTTDTDKTTHFFSWRATGIQVPSEGLLIKPPVVSNHITLSLVSFHASGYVAVDLYDDSRSMCFDTKEYSDFPQGHVKTVAIDDPAKPVGLIGVRAAEAILCRIQLRG